MPGYAVGIANPLSGRSRLWRLFVLFVPHEKDGRFSPLAAMFVAHACFSLAALCTVQMSDSARPLAGHVLNCMGTELGIAFFVSFGMLSVLPLGWPAVLPAVRLRC